MLCQSTSSSTVFCLKWIYVFNPFLIFFCLILHFSLRKVTTKSHSTLVKKHLFSSVILPLFSCSSVLCHEWSLFSDHDYNFLNFIMQGISSIQCICPALPYNVADSEVEIVQVYSWNWISNMGSRALPLFLSNAHYRNSKDSEINSNLLRPRFIVNFFMTVTLSTEPLEDLKAKI